jgi:hypothetical protein
MSTSRTPDETRSSELGVPVRSVAGSANANLEIELKSIFARHERLKPLFVDLAELLIQHVQAEYVAFCRKGAGDDLVLFVTKGHIDQSDDSPCWQAFQAACATTFQRLDVFVGALPTQLPMRVVAAPIYAPSGQPFVLAAMLGESSLDSTARIAAVDQVAGAASHWQLMQTLARLDWEAQASSAAAELMAKIETSASLDAACFLTVEQLQAFFQCDQVAIGLTRREGSGAPLVAISGMAQFDRSSEAVEAIQNALDESLIRDQLTAWPPLKSKQRHATLAHRKLLDVTKAKAVVTTPLTNIDDLTIGALLFIGRREILHRTPRVQAVEAIAPHIATSIDTRRKIEPSRLHRAWRSLVGSRGSRRRHVVILAAISAVALLPLCPWRYKVRNDCRVEPVVRRFTVVPYDGILKNTCVRPGDLVVEGQVLASMDDRELRWELSGVAAERGRVAKQRDVAMAAHDTSEKQMAQLEMERLDLKIKLLKNREANLDVTSPIAGVILRGDLQDAEGAPVRVGQGLFEVAPLDRLKLELSVAEEELPSVRPGMTVTARLDGLHGKSVAGTIDKIYPQSEIREGKNVFVAEVALDNPNNLLRPGMSGRAKVVSRLRPLGWIWFHKAWHRLRNWWV